MQKYLEDQSASVNQVGMKQSGGQNALVPVVGGGREVRHIEMPCSEVLEEFKTRVRNWMAADNAIKKLTQMKKEQMALKKELTKQVLEFMAKYNIEDLNTKDGKLRYKITAGKAPVTRATIRQRMAEMYGKAATVEEMIDYVFSTDEKIERVTLKRLKCTRETNID